MNQGGEGCSGSCPQTEFQVEEENAEGIKQVTDNMMGLALESNSSTQSFVDSSRASRVTKPADKTKGRPKSAFVKEPLKKEKELYRSKTSLESKMANGFFLVARRCHTADLNPTQQETTAQ